ncbi:T9SS type A sorting domain-containing protein [candidate division KSB1 bacterium]|nr:T9SS type A sorting domain-containing protein [candidate division KSB1 bacterium]
MKRQLYIVLFILIGTTLSFAQLDTRLMFVSNYKSPVDNTATVIFDVQIKGDGTAHPIRIFQNAIRLNGTLTQKLQSIVTENRLFPNVDDGGTYQINEAFPALPDQSATWIQLLYQHRSGESVIIPSNEEWIRVVTFRVTYETVEQLGAVDWYPDPMPPIYFVSTMDNVHVQGAELPPGSELLEINLNPQVVPVELISFEAASTDGVVDLSWKTASETENLGFNILRSESEKGEYSRLNKELIHGAVNSTSENSYSFNDTEVHASHTYFYKLVDIDTYGNQMAHGPVQVVATAPKAYELGQNFPNPFNPETRIKYKVKETGRVQITIFNTRGQEVRTLVDENLEAGSYERIWDGRDDNQNPVSSGLYFYRMQAGDYTKIQKMQLLH